VSEQYTLVLGRDMNKDGTNIGPFTKTLLEAAVSHQKTSGTILVVAPGFNPDFPGQTESFATMMARHLKRLGVNAVEVLQADHFSTYGELAAYRDFLEGKSPDRYEVIGYRGHLWRARVEALQVGGWKWGRGLKPVSVPGGLTWFDYLIEPFKWVKLLLPRPLQIRAIAFWKETINRRTSY